MSLLERDTYKGYFDNMGTEKKDIRPPLSVHREATSYQKFNIFDSVY